MMDAVFQTLLSLQEAENIPFLQFFLGFTVLVTIFHTYLDIRQLQAIKLPEPPKELKDAFKDNELYSKSQKYSLDKWWYKLYHGVFDRAETLAMLLLNGLPYLWSLSCRLLDAGMAHLPDHYVLSGRSLEISQSIVFVLLTSLLSSIAELPWSLYFTFVLEEKHGFNKQTLGLFFSDFVKGLVLGGVFIPPITAGLTYILMVAGPWVPLYLWGFMLALSLLLLTIYPTLIAPLFNKFENLPEGSLKSSIEELAGRLAFPLTKLYKMDGSKRSGHSNAYMYGFFKNKRIVLYDTLIDQCSEKQVTAVLAHELGHWKLGHTPRLFLVSQLYMLLHFGLFTLMRNSGALYRSFGFHDVRPALMALVLFGFVTPLLDEVLGYVSNVISRRFEFQADAFAVGLDLGAPLREALLRLEETNKAAMNVDPWYSAYHYSHPPLVERLKAINQGVACRAGQEKKGQ